MWKMSRKCTSPVQRSIAAKISKIIDTVPGWQTMPKSGSWLQIMATAKPSVCIEEGGLGTRNCMCKKKREIKMPGKDENLTARPFSSPTLQRLKCHQQPRLWTMRKEAKEQSASTVGCRARMRQCVCDGQGREGHSRSVCAQHGCRTTPLRSQSWRLPLSRPLSQQTRACAGGTPQSGDRWLAQCGGTPSRPRRAPAPPCMSARRAASAPAEAALRRRAAPLHGSRASHDAQTPSSNPLVLPGSFKGSLTKLNCKFWLRTISCRVQSRERHIARILHIDLLLEKIGEIKMFHCHAAKRQASLPMQTLSRASTRIRKRHFLASLLEYRSQGIASRLCHEPRLLFFLFLF